MDENTFYYASLLCTEGAVRVLFCISYYTQDLELEVFHSDVVPKRGDRNDHVSRYSQVFFFRTSQNP